VRAEFKVSILLVTHDLEECFELGDEMFVMREGRIVQSGAPRDVLAHPANVEVARILGLPNLFNAEITALDPGRNTSRLKLADFELTGPYYPGRLLGDRVWSCISAEDVRVAAQNGPNRVAVKLLRVSETPRAVRLEFSGDITAEMSRAEFERQKDNKEWLVEFPPQSIRVL
jgi:ABC-type sulfate/molybdate transport systems ATPase subunit